MNKDKVTSIGKKAQDRKDAEALEEIVEKEIINDAFNNSIELLKSASNNGQDAVIIWINEDGNLSFASNTKDEGKMCLYGNRFVNHVVNFGPSAAD